MTGNNPLNDDEKTVLIHRAVERDFLNGELDESHHRQLMDSLPEFQNSNVRAEILYNEDDT